MLSLNYLVLLPHLLVTVVSLVLPHLHPGAEAVRTEGEVALCALDPHHAGLVDVISATNTEKLLTEVERHFSSLLLPLFPTRTPPEPTPSSLLLSTQLSSAQQQQQQLTPTATVSVRDLCWVKDVM